MKNKISIVSFLALGSLLGGLIYWDSQQNLKDQKKNGSINRLDKLLIEDLSRITLTNQDKKFTAVQNNSKWFLTDPIEDDADEKTIQSILDAFSGLKYDRLIDTNITKWQEYGLAPPTQKVTFTMKSGKTRSFGIGKKTVTGDSVYISDITNKKTYTASPPIVKKLDRQLFDLRNKSVFEVDLSQVNQLTYKSSAPEYVIFSKKNESFELQASSLKTPPKIDSTKVFNFLTDLTLINVKSFYTGEFYKIRKGLSKSKAWYQISVSLKDKTTISRKFYVSNKKLWVEITPKKYGLLDDKHQTKLRKSLGDFASHKIFDFLPEQVKQLTLDGRKIDITNKIQPQLIDLSELEYTSSDTQKAKKSKVAPTHQLKVRLKEKNLQIDIWKFSDTNIALQHNLSDKFFILEPDALDILRRLKAPSSK